MRTPVAVLFLVALPAAAFPQLRQAAPRQQVFTVVPTGVPPIGVRAGTAPTSIGLRWGCPEGASGYDVYATAANGVQAKLTPTPIPPQCVQDVGAGVIRSRPGVPGAPGAPAMSTAPTYSTGFTHSGLAPQSSYTYVVVALYPNGSQGASPPLAASADPVQPPPVTALPTSARNVTLSWGAMAGANWYQVHRKLAGQTAFVMLATPTNTTTWTDGTVLSPGQHQYFVQAANGLPSAPVTVTLPPVAAPNSLIAQDFLGGEARLTWDRVPGATGYHVFRQLQGEPGFTQLTTNPVIVQNNTAVYTFPGPRYNDQRAPKAQPVRYYVQAVDGAPSAPVAVIIGIPSWSEVRKFSGSSEVFLNWGGGSGATSVQVQRASSSAGPFAPVPATLYFNGEARVPGNPIDVPQYFKLVVVYSTGVTESLVIQVTVRSATTGGTCYGSVGATGVVTWQNYSC